MSKALLASHDVHPKPPLRLVYSAPHATTGITIIDGERYFHHANGGGLVAVSAHVAPSVFVGPEAKVCDYAIVRGTVRVMHQATVAGHATVSGSGKIRDQARVDGCAILRCRISVRSHAHITGTALLDGCIIVDYYAYLGDGVRLFGSLRVE